MGDFCKGRKNIEKYPVSDMMRAMCDMTCAFSDAKMSNPIHSIIFKILANRVAVRAAAAVVAAAVGPSLACQAVLLLCSAYSDEG